MHITERSPSRGMFERSFDSAFAELALL